MQEIESFKVFYISTNFFTAYYRSTFWQLQTFSDPVSTVHEFFEALQKQLFLPMLNMTFYQIMVVLKKMDIGKKW